MITLMKSPAATRRTALGLACLMSLCSLSGCSTYSQRIRTARENFYVGRIEPAKVAFEQYIETHPDDADATSLDLAIVQMFDGQPAEAEETLRRVRDNLDHFEQTDVMELGVSMLSDDQRLAYSGADYEKVLTRVFLALANLLDDGQDAEKDRINQVSGRWWLYLISLARR